MGSRHDNESVIRLRIDGTWNRGLRRSLVLDRLLDCRLAVLASVLGLLLGAVGADGATCRSTCAEQRKACTRACAGSGSVRRDCRAACAERSTCTPPGAPIGTLAYGVTDCVRDTQGVVSLGQRLLIRRGNCDATTVPVLGATPLAPSEQCVGERGGVIQRNVVLPDGSGVVFEVTNEFSTLPSIKGLELPGKGLFFVRADGTGLRRLGDASHAGVIAGINGVGLSELFVIAVSPDGRTVAFTDHGPGPDGRETDQVFALDLATGHRNQLTLRPATDDSVPPRLSCVAFLDNRTVTFCNRVFTTEVLGFLIRDIFTVPTDGGRPGLEETVEIAAVPGGAVVPQFSIAGTRKSIAVTGLFYPANPVDHYDDVGGLHLPAIEELFLVDGTNVLQLTKLDRADTTRAGRGGVVSGRRVFFNASADPCGTNPDEYCQIFSIGVDGAGLKQLTRLTDAARPSSSGCFSSNVSADHRTSCSIDRYFADRRSGTVLFTSDCNPVGENPLVGRSQVFAMRPDGAKTRQLTPWHETDTPPGTVHVYENGPVAYQ